MHFRLPKPLHGSLEFAGEVGIIVVGVLIVLAAEQLLEALHDRHLADKTRASIKQELQTGLASLSFRRDDEPCIAHRLSEVRRLVGGWGRAGTFKAPQWIGAPRRSEPSAL